jgi:Holliday junction resolvase RusA-like endonuclease
MNVINIKPLSVNQCWRGRRFKTNEYKRYERILLLSLKPLKLPKQPFKIDYEFGFSSKLADIDNPVKPFQDILCKKYKFDDRYIFEINIKKVIGKKGKEYIKFNIETIKN